LDPKYPEALFCLGTSKLKTKEIEEAKAIFTPIQSIAGISDAMLA
jgi:TolA-binding protein